MLFATVLGALAVFASTAAAIPKPTPRSPCGKCKHKLQRRAWHTFSDEEKRAYIDAELCLMNRPATLGLPGARNRFEELQSIHQVQSAIIHGVGAFLPYHRLHMYAHEELLRNECGYKGAQPWWDETRDAGKVSQSDILDPVTGFGGDGVRPGNCIVDGPFANFTNAIGPGYWISDSCITRFVNDAVSAMAGQEYIDFCYRKTTFLEFWPCAELCPHRSGHGAIGGRLIDAVASPGDPLFYLHHTWLDKVFWDWQALDLPARLTDMGGRLVQLPRGTPPPPPDPDAEVGPPEIRPNPEAFPPSDSLIPDLDSPFQVPAGDPGNETTLTHILNMIGLIPNATIADVMDIGGPLLCYEYV
ncbi:tyrosinase [Podospora aff. communis PSN243]|uniref:Tyrosinase n=1 Tax=Podospora aff. communis PSN243 TaxID=3040156 RepID=A0AAV9GQZ8_9PEZI|nr:tyrosinase [Podospora aff. communis PSN243]